MQSDDGIQRLNNTIPYGMCSRQRNKRHCIVIISLILSIPMNERTKKKQTAQHATDH